jgi:hypothetical protein
MLPRTTSLRRALIAVLFALLALGPVTPAAAVTTGTARAGAIIGSSAVYTGDFTVQNRIDLYSVPLRGATPVRLSAGLPDGEVINFAGAGDRVIFSWFSSGRYGLYSAPLSGGLPTRLNPEYSDNGAGNQMAFAVAGDSVVYAATQERRDVGVLYSVPVAGGVSTRLSLELPDPVPGVAWSVRNVYVSDNNSTVAYTMALNGNSQLLYSVPLTGGASVRLNASGETVDDRLSSIALAPDGSRAVYLAPTVLIGGQGSKLISVAANGSDRQELDSAAQLGFKITADSSRVIYFASSDPFAQSGELRSVAIGGGTAAVLSADAFSTFALDPSGATVFLLPVGGGLQRVAVAGGAVETLFAQGGAGLNFMRFSSGGDAVFAASDGTNPGQLYRYPLSGGTPTPISDPAVSGFSVGDFLLAGERAVYTPIAAAGELPQLYSVALAGGPSTRLNGPYEGSENFISALSTSSTTLLYGVATRASGQRPAYSRLLIVPANGSTAPQAINTAAATDPQDRGDFTLHLPLLRR